MAQPDQHREGGGRGRKKRSRGRFNLAIVYGGHQQPTAATFIPSTDQSQNQGLFRQPQKPVQQPAAQQQTQQQPLKREKKALLIINPDTNKPINVDVPSEPPEPEPLVPLVSPTTYAKREFQQEIGQVLTKPSSVSSKAGSLDDSEVQLSKVLPEAPSQPLRISNVNLQEPTHAPLLSNLSDKIRGHPTAEKKVDVESENKEPGKEPELEIIDVPKPVEKARVIQHPPEMTREPPTSPQPVKPIKETALEEKVSVEVVAELKEPDPSEHEDQSEELVDSEPSVEPNEKEVEEEAVDTEEKKEGEISDESTDDGQDEPTSKRSCTVQSDHPPQRDSSGRLKYDREYLLSFRFLKECKEPPKELLLFSDSTLLELIRRSKYDEPSLRRDAFLPPFSTADVKRQSKGGRSNRGNQGPPPRVIEIEVEKVELSKSENAWKRATEVTAKLSEEEKETSDIWVPRKIVASDVPTTIDKFHVRDDYPSDGRRGVQQPHTPEKLETDRLRRLGNRPQETATKRLGPSTWSKQQRQQPQSRSEPQKVKSTKYGGRSSKIKKTAGPAPSGSRRSATQLIATEAKKQQKDVIAAVALQTGYKVQPTPVVSDALSEEDVEKKSESLYAELCSNLDYKEALLCVSEMRSPGKLHKLVFAVLNASMEKTSKCRHTAGVLFDRLVKEGHLSSESLLKGLNELLEFAEDLECDLPKFWDYVAEVLAPPVVGGGLPLADLKQAHDQVLQSGKMGKLVAKTLQKCTTLEKISQDHVSRIWSESGLDWTSDLRVEPSDVQYLVEDHSLQFLSHSSPPAIQVHSGVSHDKQQEWIHRLQLKLSSSEDTNDDVVSFIEKHHSEHCHSPPFIYCLSCAFINAGVSGSGDNVVYKTDLLERRCPVLKHFVDHHSNLQIDIIYGLQVTLSKKQHPKGILDKLFTLLYEHDVIGEDTFMLWEEGGREDLEGRGVALMSAKPFMEWLRSVDSQEGQ